MGMQAHQAYMQQALSLAKRAMERGEVPVGAVVVQAGKVVGQGFNQTCTKHDPTGHAEIVALREAAAFLGNERLTDCALYVTLEPCAMCAGAIVQARLTAVYFGAADAKAGCCGSVYRITEDSALGGAFVPAYGGLLAEQSTEILQQFFAGRRQHKKEESQ